MCISGQICCICQKLPEDGRDSRSKHVGVFKTNIKLSNKLVIHMSMYVIQIHGKCILLNSLLHTSTVLKIKEIDISCCS
jgi:hypothetical protein